MDLPSYRRKVLFSPMCATCVRDIGYDPDGSKKRRAVHQSVLRQLDTARRMECDEARAGSRRGHG
jgi:hypothetical protein